MSKQCGIAESAVQDLAIARGLRGRGLCAVGILGWRLRNRLFGSGFQMLFGSQVGIINGLF